MVVNWVALGLLGMAILTLLCVAPVAFVVLATSPEARRTTRNFLSRLAPLGVAGVLLVLLLAPVHDRTTRPRMFVDSPEVAAPSPPQEIANNRIDEGVAPAPPMHHVGEPFSIAGSTDAAPTRVHTYSQVVSSPTGVLLLGGVILLVVLAVSLGAMRGSSGGWFLAATVACLVLGGFFVTYFRASHSVQGVEEVMSRSPDARVPGPLVQAPHEQQLIKELLARQGANDAIPLAADEPAKVPPADERAADVTRPVSITSIAAGSNVGVEVSELPDWVEEWPRTLQAKDFQAFVLTSRRYASPAEAEAELLETLRPRLNSYLQAGGLPAATDLSVAEVLQSNAVIERVQEEFLVDLGSSQAPVYRMTWQVWLQPSVRESLGEGYRLSVRDQRLWQLGIGVALATLVCGAWATYFRVDDATHGRYRGRLGLAAAGATFAGVAAALLV